MAQQRPIVTEPAGTVPEGSARFELGFEFLQDATFRLSGLKGDLSRIGVYGLRLGVGPKAEVQILGSIQDFLNISETFPGPYSEKLDFLGTSSSDYGDITVGTKLRLKDEKYGWPALGMRFAVQIPIASNEKGIGNDVANIFSTLLIEQHFFGLRATANLGLALLGDPLDGAAQDDLVLYGLALFYPATPSINLLLDFHGRAGSGRHTGIPVSPEIVASRSGIGTEQQKRLRLAVQIKAVGLYWDAGIFVGFRATDPSTGVLLGLSKDFQFPF